MKQVDLNLTPGTQYLLHDRIWELTDQTDIDVKVGKVYLRSLNSNQVTNYTIGDFAGLLVKKACRPVDSPEKDVEYAAPLKLEALPPGAEKILMRRLAFAKLANIERMGPRNPKFLAAIEALANSRNEEVPSPSSVYRWGTTYRLSGFNSTSLAMDLVAGRQRKSSLPDGVFEAIEQHVFYQMVKGSEKSDGTGIKFRPLRDAFDDILEAVARDLGYDGYVSISGHRALLSGVAPRSLPTSESGAACTDHVAAAPKFLKVSYETVRRIWKRHDRYEETKARWGRQVAEKKEAARLAGAKTTRALERVEIDHFRLDIHVRVGKRFEVRRAWLTLAVDHFTGAILAWTLSFVAPSVETVLATLRVLVLPKTSPYKDDPDSEEFPGLLWESPFCGIPDLVVVDNGLELQSKGLREACARLGIILIFAPPRTPWYKGVVERKGGVLNVQLIHILKGSTLAGRTEGLDYDPKGDACISESDLRKLLYLYLGELNSIAPRRGKLGTPLERWNQSVRVWPVRLPSNDREFDMIFRLTEERELRQDGIQFYYLRYNSPQLGRLYHVLNDARKVEVRFDPCDLRSIDVIDPRTRTPIKVPCLTEFADPHPWSVHRAWNAWNRAQGVNPELAAQQHAAAKSLREFRKLAEARGLSELRKWVKRSAKDAEFAKVERFAEPEQKRPFMPEETLDPSPAALDVLADMLDASIHEEGAGVTE